MKLYIIKWGYYSCDDGGAELDSIWTTKEKAFTQLKSLARDHSAKKGKHEGLYTNGDFWVSCQQVVADARNLYLGDEEC